MEKTNDNPKVQSNPQTLHVIDSINVAEINDN